MSDAVRDAYDAMARLYTEVNLGDLERVALDRERLECFARLVSGRGGVVADLGCGPGHVVDALARLGVEAVGYDLSPALIGEARRLFPASRFRLGDLGCLDCDDSSLAGIVSRYSLIHLDPARLRDVFAEWARVLEPCAPVLVSFFASGSSATHGRTFDHAVVTAHELCAEAVVEDMRAVGFDDFEVATRRPLPGERALDHATILACRGRG